MGMIGLIRLYRAEELRAVKDRMPKTFAISSLTQLVGWMPVGY